jgi:lipoate-protein ligase A
MKYLDLSLPTPEENLACDEALLDLCESGGAPALLRVWEPTQYFVVIGYANRAQTEVHLEFCERHRIPVLRRCTGGGTVLQGPGCLNFSLLLEIHDSGSTESIASTNRLILQRHKAALEPLLRAPIEVRGQTDLAIGGLKFSGNAQRRRKRFLIFHGSLLLDLDIGLMENVLPLPSKEPSYRLRRSHTDFLVNLKTSSRDVKAALQKVWNAGPALQEVPLDSIRQLAREKYLLDEWNFKF